LNRFQTALVRTTWLLKGFIDVVVIPQPKNEHGNSGRNPTAGKQDTSTQEQIIAAALWLPPGQTLDIGSLKLLRSGLLNIVRGWGIVGTKESVSSRLPAPLTLP
jgi:hypothetical protein